MADESSNTYIALRAAKIARNKARLKVLGLDRPHFCDSGKHSTKRKVPPPETPLPAINSLRRSSRVRKNPNYTGPSLTVKKSHNERDQGSTKLSLDHEPVKKLKHKNKSLSRAGDVDTGTHPQPGKFALLKYPSNSARSLNIDLEKLVLGKGDKSGLLGKQLTHRGKEAVMVLSAQIAADGFTGDSISFNKYSGVQQWGSNALFLWINLDAPKSEVINDFPNAGQQVTWFGGSRMHDETNVIRHLMYVGKRATESTHQTGIVLWCRKYNAKQKCFEPYTCLGRLSYQNHEPGTRPIRFVWNLLDFDRLHNNEDAAVRQQFKRLVSAS